MTYTIYKSTDPDAPQISYSAGSVKGILKACLFTGYGTGADRKEPAGWEMPFDDGYKAAFQPVDSDGENLIIYIDNTSGSNCAIKLAKSMADIDNNQIFANYYLRIRNNIEWFIVAGANWCWLHYKQKNNEAYYSLFMGNISSPLPENKNRTIMGLSPPNSTIFSGSYITGSGGPVISNGFGGRVQLKENGALVWIDVLLSHQNYFLGKLPLVKLCAHQNNVANWHEAIPSAFIVQLKNGGAAPVQAVMDFNDVI